MFLTAIIIDDEQNGIDGLAILIRKYAPHVRIIAQCNMAREAIAMIENYKPDIVFLDINMPEMNGFEFLEKLSQKNFDLIFTTAHDEYALRALKANAIDYLLKPIDYMELETAVAKVKARKENHEKVKELIDYKSLFKHAGAEPKDKLLIYSKTGIQSIDIHEIISLESKSNYTKIYLDKSQTIVAAKTLKEFDAMLCLSNKNFMRIHHSFIINLNKVSRFLRSSDNVVMSDNQSIPLSKRRKDEFFKWLDI
jgi:two-component system LytT family response regulator